MKETKRLVQRNLPITQTYRITGSRYTPLLDGIGECCQNCGRMIANIATVEGNDDKVSYTVGMDCAETLSGIKGDFTFEYIHKANFTTAKGVRAWIQRYQKKDCERFTHKIEVKINTNPTANHPHGYIYLDMEQVSVESGRIKGRAYRFESLELKEYILPMIKDLVQIPNQETHPNLLSPVVTQ